MSLVLKRRLAACVAAAAAALGGSAGTAAACHGGSNVSSVRLTASSVTHHAFVHRGYWGDTVTTYLGLTRDQLEADLKAGQTLAQVANATPGKSASGLVDAIVAPWKVKLDAAVASGRLSSAKEASILTHLTAKVTAVVNGDWHGWWGRYRDHHRRH